MGSHLRRPGTTGPPLSLLLMGDQLHHHYLDTVSAVTGDDPKALWLLEAAHRAHVSGGQAPALHSQASAMVT